MAETEPDGGVGPPQGPAEGPDCYDEPNPVEDVWRAYWLPLLTNGGEHAPNLEQIKAELFDAYMLVDRARAVYLHVTGGACDDLTAPPEMVCELADRLAQRRGAQWTTPPPPEGEDNGQEDAGAQPDG